MLYVHALVVTMDGEKQIWHDGALLVRDGKIADVGNASNMIKMYPEENRQDMDGAVIMPGLVNTHTHAPMSFFRGLADDLPLMTWLNKYIWPIEKSMIDEDFIRWGVRLAMLEMLASGTTLFSDMYFFEDVMAEEVTSAGMRALLGEGVIDFPTPDSKTPDEQLEHLERLFKKYHGSDSIRISVCAHSPYTCSSDLLTKTKKFARRMKARYHIHVAETKGEQGAVKEARENESPAAYLDRLGILDENTIAAHSVWLSDEDIEIYKNRGVSVSHNPSSNLKLGSGIAPIPAMMKAGVNVTLGTDGAASNNSLNMFNEMRLASLIHKGVTLDPEVCGAYSILEAATINGAKALGLDDVTGSLEIGKQADFIVVSMERAGMRPLYDPVSHLVYSASAEDVKKVYVDGKLLYRDGEYFTLNKDEIFEAADAMAKRIRDAVKG